MENRKELNDVEAVEEQNDLQVNSVDENSQTVEGAPEASVAETEASESVVENAVEEAAAVNEAEQMSEEAAAATEIIQADAEDVVNTTDSVENAQGAEANTENAQATEKKRPIARKDMTWRQWTWHEMKRNKIAYLMIAPFMFVFILFTCFPVVLSLVLSFTSFNMLELNWDMFVGISNYTRLFFEDDIFLLACKNTLVFAMITGPVSYILSFLVAWFINELSPRIRAIVTLIFYAPSISGSVYLIWATLFSDDAYGWVNGVLLDLGLIDSAILWFHDENYAMTLCIVVALWMSLGTAFLSFIAGLQTINKSLFEAAAVDGIKNRWQELWFITLPMMRPQLMFGAVMAITGSFGFGGVVTALCGFPSVNYSCHTIMHCLEDYGSQRWEVGYASAIAFVLFLIMIGANTLVNKMLSKVGQ